MNDIIFSVFIWQFPRNRVFATSLPHNVYNILALFYAIR